MARTNKFGLLALEIAASRVLHRRHVSSVIDMG
jgi:hypothetical protein